MNLNHHPVCAAEVASRHFLIGASTPPGQEGRWPRPPGAQGQIRPNPAGFGMPHEVSLGTFYALMVCGFFGGYMRHLVLGLTIGLALTGSAWAEPSLRVIPPSGATFAPGQRFDVRLEGDDLRGQPGQFTIEVNGRDQKREIFGTEEFKIFPAPQTGRGSDNSRHRQRRSHSPELESGETRQIRNQGHPDDS